MGVMADPHREVVVQHDQLLADKHTECVLGFETPKSEVGIPRPQAIPLPLIHSPSNKH